MQFLKRYMREAVLAGLVLVTLIALVVINASGSKPASEKASIAELLGAQSNRTAPGAAGGAAVTDSQIAAYQQKLRSKSDDNASLGKLGLAYLQKAREVGDPSYYSKAEGVLKKSLEVNPKNIEAMGGMGALALSRHQFAQALEWGQKAQALRPDLSYNYGVMADALIELGRYDEAVQVIQKMVDLRPDISSYTRVSYIRELYGKSEPAIEAMQQAVAATGPTLENRAWIIYQLGTLHYNRNDLAQAEAAYNEALFMIPDYVYAQAGMARLKVARKDIDGALALYAPIVQRMPLPEFAIELGDLYTAAGKPEEAKKQYDLVRAIQRIYNENGVDTDMEMALFDADHNFNLPQALEKAKKQMSVRPSIKAADVLAWTLYQSGDYKAAKDASQQALRLGTQDALAFFHAGMIHTKLGETTEARAMLEKALALNPNFSFLHAPTARQTLTQLGGPVAAK